MPNTIELVTKLRDQLTGPLRAQAAALGGWQAKAIMAGIAATGAAIAIARLTQQFIRFADQLTAPLSRLQDTAEGLRISASELAGLQFVIDQAGGSAENLDPIFARMRASISGAADAGSTAARALDELNLSQAQLAQMNASDQFITITGALSQYAGTADQGRLAQELLGRGAVDLRGALNLSETQIRSSIDAAREMGVVMGDDAYAAADAFQDRLKVVKDRFVALQMEGLQPNLPAINEMLDSLLEMASNVVPMLIDDVGDLVAMLSDLAGAFNDVKQILEAFPEPEFIERFRTGLTGWEKILGPLGWGISAVRQGVSDTDDATTTATPGLQVYTDAMNALRDAANQAEVELAGVAAQVEAVESARQYKKDEGYQDIVAAREAGSAAAADYDVEVTLTAEEMKLAAAEERIDAEKQMNVERLQALEAAEAASAEAIAAKRMETETAVKQAQLAAEAEIARARDAAISRGIDQTVEFGMSMMHAGAEGQAAWDQFWANFAMQMFDMVFSEAFGMLLQVLTGGGTGFFGNLFGSLFQHGGTVQHAASGLSVPGVHRGDRVPALLEPGERVLTREETRNYAGSSARGSTVVNLSLGSMFSSASRADLQKAGKVLREVMDAEGI